MNTIAVAPAKTRTETPGFWERLLRDQSMKSLSSLEQLLTGCEIIAALDDLELLDDITA